EAGARNGSYVAGDLPIHRRGIRTANALVGAAGGSAGAVERGEKPSEAETKNRPRGGFSLEARDEGAADICFPGIHGIASQAPRIRTPLCESSVAASVRFDALDLPGLCGCAPISGQSCGVSSQA